MVTHPVVHRELRRGLVKTLKVQSKLPRRRAGLLYVKRPSRPTAIERVMAVVREECAKTAR
jgi:DNA-binding transcriptional LysR family regulator